MRQIRSAVNRLIERIGSDNGHPVIAVACVLLAAALIAEYIARATTDASSTVSVQYLALVLVILVGLIGGMFRPRWFLWAALVAGEILMLAMSMITPLAIKSLEEHVEQQPQSQPSEPRSTAALPLAPDADRAAVQQAELQSLIDDEEAKLESLGLTGDSLLGELRCPLSPDMMRLLTGLLTELYANIAKHADPTEWYAVSISFDAEEACISVSDTIAEHDGKLGLRSGLDRYRTIIETAGGSFAIQTEQRHWQLDTTIPNRPDNGPRQ